MQKNRNKSKFSWIALKVKHFLNLDSTQYEWAIKETTMTL